MPVKPTTINHNAPMINIGASKETIAQVHAAIMAILNANVQNRTKVCALETLRTITKVDHTTVSNCTFTTK